MTDNTAPTTGFNRRRFLQIVAVAGAAGACWQLGLFRGDSGLTAARRSLPIMGTYLNLTVYGRDIDRCEEAIDATFQRMLALEKELSRHMATSPLHQLNSSGTLPAPGRELLAVLRGSLQLSEETDGAFDVTMLPLLTLYSDSGEQGATPAPAILRQTRTRTTDYRKLQVSAEEVRLSEPNMAVTLDGIAKGYIVDQGVAALKAEGFGQVFVDAGGDLMVTGAKPDGSPWRIGIMNPRKDRPFKPVAFPVTERAVATSGDYFQAFTPDMRNHHIIDPHTGYSSPELASCTVTAPTAMRADGLATAVMVLGRHRGLELLETLPGCEGYLIDKQLNGFATSGFFA
ncbi:MAG: FAD:protein FMN transferase [Desulfopila sp.]